MAKKSAKKTKSAGDPSAAPAAARSVKPAKPAKAAAPAKAAKPSKKSATRADAAASRSVKPTPATTRSTTARSTTTARDFPRDFLWGTATSATQIDGGDRASDWYHFCQKPGRILDGGSSDPACDHWNRYESDFALMKSMGLGAYRFGVDWSRFQPTADSEFDTAALEHVRGMLASLKRKNIRPLLTLHHFAVPQWWLEKGGFVHEANLGDFYRFARFIVEGVGDLVEDYITFNEPNIYALLSYVMGVWPPAHKGLYGYIENMKVQRSMVLAHFTLYDMIREIHGRKNFKTPRISIAKHMRLMDPKNPESRLDVDRANVADYRLNRLVPDCIHSGRMLPPFGSGEQIHDPAAWDFFGLNYYSRDFVNFSLLKPQMLFINVQTSNDAPKNDLGWEIYPEGLERLLLDVHARYGLPIRITENGTADAADAFRGQYLIDHLQAMQRAMLAGVAVEGYYHWSFMDNFEWAEGYTARFGLVEVDFATQNRTVRPSGNLYSQVARTGKIPLARRAIPSI